VAARNEETGWGLKIHVDAASGGFVGPFAFPDLKWWVQQAWASGQAAPA